MPRLLPFELGNGIRPSSPSFERTENPTGVAVLDLSDASHELVGDLHAKALDPDDKTSLLTGAIVFFDNPSPRSPLPTIPEGTPMWTPVNVGASTLHEAATEVVRCVHDQGLDTPGWVASTSDELAKVVAEHFTIDLEGEDGESVRYSTCKKIKLSEVPS